MANTKQAKFIIDVSAEKKRVTESSVRFFSYDSKTAEIIIQAEKEEQLISKSIVSNVEIFFESVDASFQPTDKLKWKDQMTVVADGLFSYLLPDELLNYQGLVAFEIYINYTNNDKSDSSYRIVYAQRSSAIDRAAGEIELVYIKDFEALKKEVALAAAETIASITEFYSGLDTYSEEKKDEMDAFSTSVGTLASAEKLKIQAELPKVQQTSTSETTKIKAEYPIIEQVATTEKEKIRAVLSTVDQTASEVSAYADRKISEYDAKFTQSNQKMNDLQQSQTELSNQLDETKKKVDAADVYRKDEVFNKPESSANVIYQILGKDITEITFTLNFKNKKTNSLVENPNKARVSANNNLITPTTVLNDYSQERYNSVSEIDKNYMAIWLETANQRAQSLFEFAILEEVIRHLGVDFFELQGLTTLKDQTTFLRSKMTNIQSDIWGKGVSQKGNKFYYTTFDNRGNNWGSLVTNESNTVEKTSLIISQSDLEIYLSDSGNMYFLAYSEQTDGTLATQLYIDYVELSFKLRVSTRDVIESMIAAYCRPLEQQINDLAQKVAAMENK